MTIPAGEANVGHDTSVAFDSLFLRRARAHLGLADDAPLVMHSAGHHMHELGSTQRTELQHADGNSVYASYARLGFQLAGAILL